MNISASRKSCKSVFLLFLIFLFTLSFLCSCQKNKLPDKTNDLDYTIITGSDIPKELQALIDKRKKESFELTFSDDAFLYIIKGYGKKNSGGYSIKINQFYQSKDSLVLDTELLGPKQGEDFSKKASYPYIVLKTELRDEPVAFY